MTNVKPETLTEIVMILDKSGSRQQTGKPSYRPCSLTMGLRSSMTVFRWSRFRR